MQSSLPEGPNERSTLLKHIARMPLLGPLALSAYHQLRRKAFSHSADYWERRYRRGGTSGPGSHDRLAEFKGQVINAFVKENRVRSVIDLGCGDGHQLQYFDLPDYLGYDVSPSAIELCRKRFAQDPSKRFALMHHFDPACQAELCLSLDVIYHLVEREVYMNYMEKLFAASTRFVVVYSSNQEKPYRKGTHERHRRFTDWVDSRMPDFSLHKHIPNPYPYDGRSMATSVSDFYIFRRNLSEPGG